MLRIRIRRASLLSVQAVTNNVSSPGEESILKPSGMYEDEPTIVYTLHQIDASDVAVFGA